MSLSGSEASASAPNSSQYGLSAVGIAPTNTTPPSLRNARLAAIAAKMPESSINSLCGALAGVASGIVTCPLDVIKTKLQTQGSYRPRSLNLGSLSSSSAPYHGMLGTAKTIWNQDGLRGMYRGLGPMLFGYLPTWAVYMSVYGSSRDYYYTKVENKTLAQVYASVTAGACSTIVTNPIWVIKTRLMSQVGSQASKDFRTPWHYHSTIDGFRQMYRAEGVRAFYAGLAPALLGLTHVAIQFPLYEYFKLRFTGLEMGEHSSESRYHQWIGIAGATFLSKVCATSATYPHEVLRTRLQTQQRNRAISSHTSNRSPGDGGAHGKPGLQSENIPRYHGVISTCRTILKEEGWRAFYHGMGTNLIRAVPAALTTMLTFETLKKMVQQLKEEGLQHARETH